MICINNFKYCYYLILADVIVDYKEQVFITEIKTNVYYSISHISPQKQENLSKSWQ